MSDSLQPYEIKHSRPLCPSLSLKVCSGSCPLHWWCHPGKLILWYSLLLLPAKGLSQHQGLFRWVSCSHQMTKILEFQLQHQSFHGVFRVDFTWLTDLISLLSKGLSRVFSSTTILKHQLFSTQPSPSTSLHLSTLHSYFIFCPTLVFSPINQTRSTPFPGSNSVLFLLYCQYFLLTL